ncbi:MAG: phosphatidylglycerol lysyltransferase domain-containing protein [Eubacteriales bacterium]|nr:phosphatidylglycerol lysyltransferase domain-containing protein [Eubacteriales bacterium]
MNLKSVSSDDLQKIKSYLEYRQCESSEINFLTFYIWRKAFNIQYAEVEGCLVIRFKDNDSPENFRFPIGGGDVIKALEKIEEHCDGRPIFYGISKQQAEFLETRGYKTSCMKAYSDYVYKTDDLINLSGRKYHSKRNHLNTFMRSYEYEYKAMDSENALECIKAYDLWFTNESQDAMLDYEKQAIEDILTHFDILDFKGGVLYANGEICAFTVSEQLTKDMAVIHIEKANTQINGAFPAINQMHLEATWSHLTYVNREEDLGLEGLRKAKLSYRPCKMIDKYKAVKL